MFLGLYGGTFDPVHLGHIHVARTIQELGIERIHWQLAARPGHRSHPQTSIEHRFNMLQLVCEAHSGFFADDTEISKPGVTYTYDALIAVREKYPDVLPCWILGVDSFATIDEWYRWDELLLHTNLLVVERPGRELPAAVVEFERAHAVNALKQGELGQILRIDVPMLPISATQIRQRLATGAVVDHLLVESVSTYIKEHDLYCDKVA